MSHTGKEVFDITANKIEDGNEITKIYWNKVHKYISDNQLDWIHENVENRFIELWNENSSLIKEGEYKSIQYYLLYVNLPSICRRKLYAIEIILLLYIDVFLSRNIVEYIENAKDISDFIIKTVDTLKSELSEKQKMQYDEKRIANESAIDIYRKHEEEIIEISKRLAKFMYIDGSGSHNSSTVAAVARKALDLVDYNTIYNHGYVEKKPCPFQEAEMMLQALFSHRLFPQDRGKEFEKIFIECIAPLLPNRIHLGGSSKYHNDIRVSSGGKEMFLELKTCVHTKEYICKRTGRVKKYKHDYMINGVNRNHPAKYYLIVCESRNPNKFDFMIVPKADIVGNKTTDRNFQKYFTLDEYKKYNYPTLESFIENCISLIDVEL